MESLGIGNVSPKSPAMPGQFKQATVRIILGLKSCGNAFSMSNECEFAFWYAYEDHLTTVVKKNSSSMQKKKAADRDGVVMHMVDGRCEGICGSHTLHDVLKVEVMMVK